MSRPIRQATAAFAALLLSHLGRAGAQDVDLAASPCPRRGNVVFVATSQRELWLCRGGAADARFVIAIGRGGVGKRAKGDDRTPIGSYALGEPRPSNQYGTFIPIDYPRPDQAARGFTGSNVGIHGPPRGVRWAATGIDWTAGCIATGTDADVEAIAEWVRDRRPSVVIR